MSFVGDLVDPSDRDALLQAAGCAPWPALRRQAEREGNRVDTREDVLRKERKVSAAAASARRDRELMELEALMANTGGGELGSVT